MRWRHWETECKSRCLSPCILLSPSVFSPSVFALSRFPSFSHTLSCLYHIWRIPHSRSHPLLLAYLSLLSSICLCLFSETLSCFQPTVPQVSSQLLQSSPTCMFTQTSSFAHRASGCTAFGYGLFLIFFVCVHMYLCLLVCVPGSTVCVMHYWHISQLARQCCFCTILFFYLQNSL